MLMFRYQKGLFLALSILTFGLSSAPSAAEVSKPQSSAKAWLEAKVKAGYELATQKKGTSDEDVEAWNKKAKDLIDETIDWKKLTKEALGKHWNIRTQAQRKLFSKLLRQMIEASYKSRLRQATQENKELKKPEDFEVEWLEEKKKDQGVFLSTEATTNDQEVVLGFELIAHGDSWRVYDVLIDDVSTIRTYRASFSQVINKMGWDGLIETMRRKIKNINAGLADLSNPSK